MTLLISPFYATINRMINPEMHVHRGFRPVLSKLLAAEDRRFVDELQFPDRSYPVPLPDKAYKGAGWLATKSTKLNELPMILVTQNESEPVVRESRIFFVGVGPKDSFDQLATDQTTVVGDFIRENAEHGPMNLSDGLKLLREFVPIEPRMPHKIPARSRRFSTQTIRSLLNIF